jgi:hypothetical protein
MKAAQCERHRVQLPVVGIAHQGLLETGEWGPTHATIASPNLFHTGSTFSLKTYNMHFSGLRIQFLPILGLHGVSDLVLILLSGFCTAWEQRYRRFGGTC